MNVSPAGPAVPFFAWRDGARKELATEVDRIAAYLDRPLKASVAAT